VCHCPEQCTLTRTMFQSRPATAFSIPLPSCMSHTFSFTACNVLADLVWSAIDRELLLACLLSRPLQPSGVEVHTRDLHADLSIAP
jgi:hypothetical protein